MAQQNPSSSARHYALRLKPHQDLKKELLEFAQKEGLKAACIVTAVGSLEQYQLRFANQNEVASRQGHFEIVSLTGVFSDSSSHFHLSLSDSTGYTTGGHVLDGNLIYTTVEIVVAELIDLKFDRETDTTYGYKELTIYPRTKNQKPKP